MPARVVTQRKQRTFTYAASTRQREKLEKGAILRNLFLRLTGAITAATTGSSKANILRGDEWAVIQRVDLLANGDQIIRTFTGEELQWWNYFLFGPRRVSTALGNNSASTSARAFDSSLIVPLALPGGYKSIDTALPTHLLSDLSMEVTWGTPASMDNGSGTLSFSTTPTLEVYSEESAGDPGPFSGSRIFRVAQETAGLTSGAQKNVLLPVGNLYRGLLIHCVDSNGADVDSIDRFVLRSGMNILADIDTEVMRQRMLFNIGQRPETINLAASADVVEERLFISSKSSVNGWYWLNLLSDGLMSELPDTLGWSELVLECYLDANTTSMDVLALEVLPIRQ